MQESVDLFEPLLEVLFQQELMQKSVDLFEPLLEVLFQQNLMQEAVKLLVESGEKEEMK